MKQKSHTHILPLSGKLEAQGAMGGACGAGFRDLGGTMNETMTIGEIAIDHYLPAKRQRRRTNTVDGYESSIRLYVVPRWGEFRISDIDPDDVQAWVDELAKECGPAARGRLLNVYARSSAGRSPSGACGCMTPLSTSRSPGRPPTDPRRLRTAASSG